MPALEDAVVQPSSLKVPLGGKYGTVLACQKHACFLRLASVKH